MRYCAHCQKPRDRKDNKTQKGQRLCSDCHAEYMRAWRARQKLKLIAIVNRPQMQEAA